MRLLVFCAILVLAHCNEMRNECEDDYEKICFQRIMTHMLSNETTASIKEDEFFLLRPASLDRSCGLLLPSLKCVADFHENCNRFFSPRDFPYQKIYELAEDICDSESEIGKGYRKSIDCILGKKEELVTRFRNVMKEIQAYQRFVYEHIDEFEDDDLLSYSAGIDCISVNILDKNINEAVGMCGEGATRILRRIEDIVLVRCPSPLLVARFEELYERFLQTREQQVQESPMAEVYENLFER